MTRLLTNKESNNGEAYKAQMAENPENGGVQ